MTDIAEWARGRVLARAWDAMGAMDALDVSNALDAIRGANVM
jgi:hypothetical protein